MDESAGACLSGAVVKRAFAILLPLALLGAAVLYLLYRTQENAILTGVRTDHAKLVEIGRQRVDATFVSVISDTAYLAEQNTVRWWLGNTNNERARANLAEDLLSFARHQSTYDQVRLLDLDGHERIRIDQSTGRLAIAPDDQLQDMSRRYFVPEIAKLEHGQIYISPFDLNVDEDGQIGAPTIRFGATTFDRDGNKMGTLVLNYEGRRLLDRVKILGNQSDDDVWVVNAEGFWLLGPRPEDEWSFMYPDRPPHSFSSMYPEVWKRIQKDPAVIQLVVGGDLFTYAWVDVPSRPASAPRIVASHQVIESDPMIVISRVSAASLADRTYTLRRNMLLTGGFLFLLMGVTSWAAARHWVARDAGQEAMRSSEARFRGLMQAAPDAVVVTDTDGKISFVNARTEHVFGYRAEQLLGRSVEMLVPERYRSGHIMQRAGYMAAPRRRAMGSGQDLFGVRADGSEFPVSISLSPVETERGPMIYAGIRDVTERRQQQLKIEDLNQRLSRDNAELQTVNRELEAFSYSVSHDLRAPLRAIDGFSQALFEDYADQLNDEGRSYIARVRAAAQRMGHLIDDLLKLSRVTRAELHVTDVDVSAAALDVASLLRETQPDRRVEFSIAPNVRVSGDSNLLKIALENLIGNAWKFTAKNPHARIELGYVPSEANRSYFIRDNGVGFDMAYGAKLFGAFQRLHDASEYPGTGIGLATVQRIIHKHGGRIWAESEVNKGTTFYFTLQAG